VLSVRRQVGSTTILYKQYTSSPTQVLQKLVKSVPRLDRATLCRGIWELAEFGATAAQQNFHGMRFKDINRFGNGMGTVWIIFVVEWFVFMGLAWYLEQVLDSGIGVRRHWLFPFQRSSCTCALPPLPSCHSIACGACVLLCKTCRTCYVHQCRTMNSPLMCDACASGGHQQS
jgi:hypothetical protein